MPHDPLKRATLLMAHLPFQLSLRTITGAASARAPVLISNTVCYRTQP